MADDVNEFLKKKNLKNITMIGYSDGGNIAYTIAINNQNVLKKLVLISCNYSTKGIKQNVLQIFIFLKKILGVFMKWSYFFRDKVWKINLIINEMEVTLGDFNKIDAQTLIISATKDVILYDHLLSINNKINNSQLKKIPKTNHFNIIKSNYLIKAIDNFLIDN